MPFPVSPLLKALYDRATSHEEKRISEAAYAWLTHCLNGHYESKVVEGTIDELAKQALQHIDARYVDRH
jgi:hypothetical protein